MFGRCFEMQYIVSRRGSRKFCQRGSEFDNVYCVFFFFFCYILVDGG